MAEVLGNGRGVVLRMQRVRPPRTGRFQPLRRDEISPRVLDRALRAFRRWRLPVIPLDDACRHLDRDGPAGRFVCLTFDGGYADFVTHGYPVLQRHGVPFTVYLPTGAPDGLMRYWWLALEQVIARNDRIALVIDRREHRIEMPQARQKLEAWHFLFGWLRTMTPADLADAVDDLCSRYTVDIDAVSREAAISWDDVRKLAADPNVTIGAATVHFPILATVPDATAQREIAMGKAVLQSALGAAPSHVAFPWGDRSSFTPRHMAMAREAGFTSAAGAVASLIASGATTDRYALPRVTWDGRISLRALRAMASGL